MKNSCFSEATSLGKPENYIFLMHILTCFEVPINLFGVYCILFKTPRKMEPVKWPLLILQLISSFDDFLISYLGIPYIYLPTMAGFPLGAINAPIPQLFLMIIMTAATGAAVLVIFENRYYHLFAKESFWKVIRRPYLLLNFLIAPVCLLPVYLAIPDQAYAISVVRESMSCEPQSPWGLVVLTLDGTLILSFCAGFGFILTTENVAFAGIVLVKTLRRQLNQSSRKTSDLQRKFVQALIIQSILPITVLVLPICYLVLCTSLNYSNQSMNNLSFSILGCHGFLSTLIMVLVHQPYRKVTLYPITQLISFARGPIPQTIAFTNTGSLHN